MEVTIARKRKQYTGEEKLAILRKRLLEGVAVSDSCVEQQRINELKLGTPGIRKGTTVHLLAKFDNLAKLLHSRNLWLRCH